MASIWLVVREHMQQAQQAQQGVYNRGPTIPLTDVTKNKEPTMVKWTEEAERVFQDLKMALCSSPVLITPDFTKDMIVQMDASETGVGAVLSQ
ncbi:hypothetical protein SKAU_G00410670 [Synaphobranchus kaupii]|uniref:Reverse transcriptase/retrotransposon-derived protein RNase H-like domain-containing protein n=1 Tax=Synaphobranchus kaupii TaxID=118154 RepID=A0A9Q1I9S0_SYNKA|nr:hypothetical protein SKAU_G00410670 [Synaphobranchus kaupii]